MTTKLTDIRSKEDFFQAPAKVACMYAYTMYKSKKWPLETFNERLKEWWRVNHNDQNNILEDLKEAELI